eukprot:CAMPEP_0168344722 /NCGR_PEP_ID=MMETSP0213-20121227/17019_1 /TAXON_ID=151035 /ORGANISM="Euplotes harpa, Strain FSP1.4" /LENGTH=198 /DNA_ID=CAMNT_0008352585 /DNA_START=12 /DNA_END=608 /DNA_ORIENTATION=+
MEETLPDKNLTTFQNYYSEFIEIFADINTKGERLMMELLQYRRMQSGFSNYDLLGSLPEGHFIYIETDAKAESDSDYPTKWVASFGQSTSDPVSIGRTYKVTLDFNNKKRYPDISFTDNNFPDLPYVSKTGKVTDEFKLFQMWAAESDSEKRNKYTVQLILYVMLMDTIYSTSESTKRAESSIEDVYEMIMKFDEVED